MPLSRVDPTYKYIDAKIKLIRRDMKKLEESYNAILDLQEEEMLYLHRFVAKESIIQAGNLCLDMVQRLKKPIKVRIIEQQLTVEVVSACSKITTSETPLEIALAFKKKCANKVRKLGLHSLDEPL